MALATSLALLTLLPQGEPVAARYLRAGEPAVVSRDDLAIELGQRYRKTEQGKRALEFLIDLTLIRNAATEAQLMPSTDATRRWVADLDRKLRSAGMSLEAMRAEKGMSLPEFEEFAGLQLAHELLVRKALELPDGEAPTGEMMKLWLQEARGKQGVVTDDQKLPPGIVTQIGGVQLGTLDLGRILVRTTERGDRERFVKQAALRECLEALARKHAIDVSPAEMAAEVTARRAEAEANPAYRGVKFEQLLEAQGMTLAELERSPVLRAQVLERKLGLLWFDDAELSRRLHEERDQVLRQHGARRRAQVLLVRVAAGASASEEQRAREKAEQISERIRREMPFAEAARSYSDDPYTKVSGGDTGWHNREGSSLPQALREAVFAAKLDELAAPIRTPEGFWLVQVTGIEPEPNDATLKLRLRQALAQEVRERILRDAKIELTQG